MADALTSGLRLETVYDPTAGRSGTFELRVVNDAAVEVVADRLALTSIVPISAPAGDQLSIVRRVSVYHEVGTGAPITIGPRSSTSIGTVRCEFPPVHANDGPASAFLIHADGTASALAVAPMVRRPGGPKRQTDRPAGGGVGPVPTRSTAADAPRPLQLVGGADLAAAVWGRMAACERAVYGDGATVLGDGAADAERVTVRVEPALGADHFRIREPATDPIEVLAGDEGGLRRALSALARGRRGERPPLGAARYEWRGFHVDLARQWYPPAMVTELIRIAGWYGLNRVHLHLTDDEGWRVPIAAFPALTEVGGWRGHGLAIPPLLGTGAAPSGGSYTPADIAGWVATAASLGIELIPEIDLPAHSFAALAALPELRDPDDTGGAISVQGFTDNVLNPGVAATMPFLERVLGEVADLFPGRWLHVGGDEVPAGAWQGSPTARTWAAARGVEGTRGIEREFMRDVIGIARRLGRQVGVWQEAAECGALQPGDGYAIGWTSSDATRALAAAGHDVVAAPAQAYYLDMADRADWDAPGAFWAGVITAETVAAFDPTAGWTPAERAGLRGVQACLWSEHVHDEVILRRLLLPRLAVFADGTWEPQP